VEPMFYYEVLLINYQVLLIITTCLQYLLGIDASDMMRASSIPRGPLRGHEGFHGDTDL